MSVPAPAAPVEALTPQDRPCGLVAAGAASLGAGAVHAAAVAAHADHRAAAAVFTVLAALQVVWGGTALVLASRRSALVGFGIGAAAVTGWLLAKTVGVPVDGLAAEPVQVADAAAAALAALSALLCASALAGRSAGRGASPWPALLAVAALAVAGTSTTAAHRHAEAAHAHGGAAPATSGAAPAAAHREPVPYDPALPIDLGGVPGVTPQQQAAAENLVAVTVSRLPRWADAGKAEQAGFRSIGDGFTGTEHLISQAFLRDDVVLDPDRPESLVYDTSQGGRRLVAAMYMLPPGTGLDEVPDVGGALVQWHTHEDLCFTPGGRVAGLTGADGACDAGLVKPVPSPMVHVWVTPHRCGPFAALEGVAGGRIAEGQTRLCDHAHGAR